MLPFRRISWSWVVVICLAVLALGLGLLGFRQHFAAVGVTPPPGQVLYLTLQLFTLESGAVTPLNTPLQIARFLAPLVSAYAIVRALLALMSVEARRGWLWLTGRHVVICGLGRKGSRLVEELRSQGKRVVVIESDEQNDDLARCRELGAVTIIGAANEEWALRRAFVDRARTLVSVTGDDHTNVETAMLAHKLKRGGPGSPLRCIIHVTDPQLQRVLREHDAYERRDDPFDLEYFNTYEIGARIMLRDPPLWRRAHHEDPVPPHLLIVGLGQLGQTLLWRAARDWRIDRKDCASRLRVSVVDKEATLRERWLHSRYPRLAEVVDLNWLPIDVHSHSFTAGEFLCEQLPSVPDVTAAYICLRDDSLAMYAALNLRRCLRTQAIPVIVSMSEKGGMSALLNGVQEDESRSSLRVVGLLDITCSWDLVSGGEREVLAQALHQGYLAGVPADSNQAGAAPSLVTWDELRDDLKASNRRQVDRLRKRLEACGIELIPRAEADIDLLELTDQEVRQLALLEHEQWVEERTRAGWICGPTKDTANRISPYLKGWEELTAEEQEYNCNMARQLPAVLAKADYAIVRRRSS